MTMQAAAAKPKSQSITLVPLKVPHYPGDEAPDH